MADIASDIRKLKVNPKFKRKYAEKKAPKMVEVKKQISTQSALYVFLAMVLVFVNDQIGESNMPLYGKAILIGGIALLLSVLGIQTIPTQALLEILKKDATSEQKVQELEFLMKQTVIAWVNENDSAAPEKLAGNQAQKTS
jgi:hypothetical protein